MRTTGLPLAFAVAICCARSATAPMIDAKIKTDRASAMALAQVKRMDTAAVARWARDVLLLPEVADAFETNGIDGPSLLVLDNGQLRDDLSIWKLGERLRVLSGIEKLTAIGAPIDCIGAFTDWSACSTSCGGGRSLRTFKVSQLSLNGGARCSHPHGATENRTCNELPCPVSCVGNWTAWSNCTRSCGGGQRLRAFSVRSPSRYGGAPCEGADGQVAVQDCNMVPCPSDMLASQIDATVNVNANVKRDLQAGPAAGPLSPHSHPVVNLVDESPEAHSSTLEPAISVESTPVDATARPGSSVRGPADGHAAQSSEPDSEPESDWKGDIPARFDVIIKLLQEMDMTEARSRDMTIAVLHLIKSLKAELTSVKSLTTVVSPGVQTARAMLHRLGDDSSSKNLAVVIENRLLRLSSIFKQVDPRLPGPLPLYREATLNLAWEEIAGTAANSVHLTDLPPTWRKAMFNADVDQDGVVTK
eukprot:SAG31_NODE_7823_length_1588_cov_17.218267_1_plen_474_part_10